MQLFFGNNTTGIMNSQNETNLYRGIDCIIELSNQADIDFPNRGNFSNLFVQIIKPTFTIAPVAFHRKHFRHTVILCPFMLHFIICLLLLI